MSIAIGIAESNNLKKVFIEELVADAAQSGGVGGAGGVCMALYNDGGIDERSITIVIPAIYLLGSIKVSSLPDR